MNLRDITLREFIQRFLCTDCRIVIEDPMFKRKNFYYKGSVGKLLNHERDYLNILDKRVVFIFPILKGDYTYLQIFVEEKERIKYGEKRKTAGGRSEN